jgi:hypothetical protein
LDLRVKIQWGSGEKPETFDQQIVKKILEFTVTNVLSLLAVKPGSLFGNTYR